jgi:hypothetical protein
MTITNTERGEISPTYSRLRARLQKAYGEFHSAVYERDPPLDEIKKLFGELVKAVRYADTCAGELDPPEQKHLNRFLAEAAEPTIEFWRDVLAAVDRGTSLEDAMVAMDLRDDLH